MRFFPRAPKKILTFAAFATVTLAALIAGCDSTPPGPDMNDAETKKVVETRKQSAEDLAKQADAALQKRGGKAGVGGGMKSIKGLAAPESK
jgi:hypothetical protein